MIRRRFELHGIVQGVGFRPHVARVASSYELTGLCGNDDHSVFIEAQGSALVIENFVAEVLNTLPPLARVDSARESELLVVGTELGFTIVESERTGGSLTLIPPDVARCERCLVELRDPFDRRFEYPFISCTNCGPRFSIIENLPYDRTNTTLRVFEMCEPCKLEYRNPLDRRFHAEPISCFDCGPKLWLHEPGVSNDLEWQPALNRARGILKSGGIIAVKGMGGFALMCDARSEVAVARLRVRKNRPGKPFALMAADSTTAQTVAAFGTGQLEILESAQRPIVLAPRIADAQLAPSVAPGIEEVGIMLPSAPIHDLILTPGMVVVATSGNVAGEPLCYRNDDALRDLAEIADAWLLNDREIFVPVEDSVLLTDGESVLPIRRSRGYAPLPVSLACDDTVLAVGGELKNTFTMTRDNMAFVSAHIGDMGSLATQLNFERSVEQMLRAHRATPALIVADLHPSYLTTSWAERYAERHNLELIRVQHHRAHALSLLAEHGAPEANALCVVFDGTGYGTDGTIWGGELLRMRGGSAERLWHLPVFQLPGGDSAVQHPWKCGVALLHSFNIDPSESLSAAAADPAELALVLSQLDTATATVPTSSAGRLFDAVASLLGIAHHITYEAQAAMELESVASMCAHNSHSVQEFTDVPGLISELLTMQRTGAQTSCIARVFHIGLAAITADAVCERFEAGELIGLTGGVMQNRMLSNLLTTLIEEQLVGRSVIRHKHVPANDGGLSLGQAAAGVLALRQKVST